MRAYGSVGTIHGMFSLLAQSTSRCDWRMYRKSQDNRVRYSTAGTGSDQRTEVVQHAALSLWNKPNSFYSGRAFREMSQLYLDLTGEMPWLVGRDPRVNFPTGLWTVRPDRLEPIPHPELFIAGYIYTGPNGEKVPLGTDQVIRTLLPNPLDPLHGLGPVQAMLVDADASRYSAQWNRNFFLNSAEPGGVVVSPTHLEDTEFEEFQLRWRETHQGINNAHRVALLENMTWVPNAMSQRDMDFANLRNQSRDVMRETVGIHKVMLGVSDDVNRANAQTGEEVFESWKIVPRLDRIKDTVNDKLLPMFYPPGADVPVEHDYVTPVPANREQDNQELLAKANAAVQLVSAGYDPKAVLEVVGLPEMDMAAVSTLAAQQPGNVAGSPASQTPIPGETADQQTARMLQSIYNGLVAR
jgi:HK97 family phage portal protein